MFDTARLERAPQRAARAICTPPLGVPAPLLNQRRGPGILGPSEALQQGCQPQGPGNLGLPEVLPARRVPAVLERNVGRVGGGQTSQA